MDPPAGRFRYTSLREIVNGVDMRALTAGIDVRLSLVGRGIQLEGHLGAPETPARGAVVCHPHPQYGGSMDNSVVVEVAAALRAAGLATLRFNFRGVGRSEGQPSGGVDEVHDVEAAVTDLVARFPGISVTLVGYSFGAAMALQAGSHGLPAVSAIVGIAPPVSLFDMSFLRECELPVCFVAGDRDAFCERTALEALAAAVPRASVVWIADADHFFAGSEGRVAEPVRRFALAEGHA